MEAYGTMAHIQYDKNTKNEQFQEENEHWDKLRPQLDDLNQQFIELLLESPYRSELEKIFSKHVFNLWTVQKSAFSSKIIEHKQNEAKLSSEYGRKKAALQTDQGEEHRLFSFSSYGNQDRNIRF